MRRLPLLVLVVAVLAGCGQSNPDLIPQSNADALAQTADRIEQACSDFDRSEARAQIRSANRQIDQLPNAVDAKLKQNLQEWVDRIEARHRRRLPRGGEETPTPDADRGADRGADGGADRSADRDAHGGADRGAHGSPDRGAHRGPDRGAHGGPDRGADPRRPEGE